MDKEAIEQSKDFQRNGCLTAHIAPRHQETNANLSWMHFPEQGAGAF